MNNTTPTKKSNHVRRLTKSPLFFLAATIILSACSNSFSYKPIDTRGITKKQEKTLGLRGYQNIAMTRLYSTNMSLQADVKRIGKQLIKANHLNNEDYTFTVLDDAEAHAFSLPSGYIYVNTGLMKHLSSDAELAAVLGHEIAHVYLRHGLQQEILRGTITPNGKLIKNISSPQTISFSFVDSQEQEADQFSTVFLKKMGYSPKAMLDVVKMLKIQLRYSPNPNKKNIYYNFDNRIQKLSEIINSTQN